MRLDRYPELEVGVRLKIVRIIGQPGREQVVCRVKRFVNNRPVETEVTMVRENFVTQYQGTTFTRFQFPLKLETFLQNISPLNHTLDPLVYPLFYPNGETGYFEAMQQQNVQRPKRVSMLEFYAHRLAYREVPFSPLHHGRKLFQQYVVDAWVRTESNRMNYPARFQAELRVERYHALHRHLENLRENPDLPDPGVPTVLPSSFCGGPRYMKQRYDDAMAIVTEDGKPTVFLTHTCNPNHPDIQRNLGNLDPVDGIKLTAADRPDIVTAVFKLHLDALKEDLRTTFGAQLANIHVIEYQKRGLPHAHILIWLKREAAIRTPEDIDSLICAEIPDPELDPELYAIVTKQMMHGPCDARCLEHTPGPPPGLPLSQPLSLAQPLAQPLALAKPQALSLTQLLPLRHLFHHVVVNGFPLTFKMRHKWR